MIARASWMMILVMSMVSPPGLSALPAMQQGSAAAQQSNTAIPAPGSPKTLGPETGSTSDNVYTNNFFGFTYEFPKGWSVVGEEGLEYLTELRKAAASGGDPAKMAILEVAEKRTHQLVTLFEYPMGTPVPFNSNIIVSSERVSHAPGIQKGSDYLLHIKTRLAANPDLKILREPADFTFGGKVFSRMDVSTEKAVGQTTYQSYAATILYGQALIFVFTANKVDRLRTLIDTLNTLQFKPELVAPPAASTTSSLAAQSVPQVIMLTSTGGVNFQSYLMNLLSAVKQKWYTVMPASALNGTKGKVVLTFGIKNDGSISNGPKVDVSSKTAPLDDAAIAAIHLTAPFRPFPPQFKGKEIRLRILFLYNIPAESGQF